MNTSLQRRTLASQSPSPPLCFGQAVVSTHLMWKTHSNGILCPPSPCIYESPCPRHHCECVGDIRTHQATLSIKIWFFYFQMGGFQHGCFGLLSITTSTELAFYNDRVWGLHWTQSSSFPFFFNFKSTPRKTKMKEWGIRDKTPLVL